jgi:hypothetical protein
VLSETLSLVRVRVADGDRDRPVHAKAVQRVDERVGPETRVAPHGQRAGGAGPLDPGDELLDEPLVDPGVARRVSSRPVAVFLAVLLGFVCAMGLWIVIAPYAWLTARRGAAPPSPARS